MIKPESRRIEYTAPTASEASLVIGLECKGSSLPTKPPTRLDRPRNPPTFRPLQVYAFGPSLGHTPINVRTLQVHYEPLDPGPVGERIAVVDYDCSRDCFYDPVDLDDPLIAMNGGLDPSESDPRFHQQMVYAIVSDALRRIEVALGRTVRRRTLTKAERLRLLIYPHIGEVANCFAQDNWLGFGYFKAVEDAIGRTLPGQTVFTCLSTDAITNKLSALIQMAMRPDLMTADRPRGGSLDISSVLQALSDLTSLLSHFGYREAVLDTIQRTAGVIYRSQLDFGLDPAREGPRISAELASNNPLLAMSQDFGEAVGRAAGLRSALLAPDPLALKKATDPFERGTIVVAAVFDALFWIYQRRTLDLFRIFHAGGGRLQGNDVPEPLAIRLSAEVERIATRVFNMCWRALDYCPAGEMELGDFLRACITADFEYSRDDPWGVRDAIMQAFNLHGIKSSSAMFFTEDALRWKLVDGATLSAKGPEELSQEGVRDFVISNAKSLGLRAKANVDVYPIETARLTAPDDTPQTMSFTQVTTKTGIGLTVVFDAARSLRYAIRSANATSSLR
jgi:hypothetical protein